MSRSTIAVPSKSRSQREGRVGQAPRATRHALGRPGSRLWFVRPLPMAARSLCGARFALLRVCEDSCRHAQCVTAAAARTRAHARVVWLSLSSRRVRACARGLWRAPPPFGQTPANEAGATRKRLSSGVPRTPREDHASAWCESRRHRAARRRNCRRRCGTRCLGGCLVGRVRDCL